MGGAPRAVRARRMEAVGMRGGALALEEVEVEEGWVEKRENASLISSSWAEVMLCSLASLDCRGFWGGGAVVVVGGAARRLLGGWGGGVSDAFLRVACCWCCTMFFCAIGLGGCG